MIEDEPQEAAALYQDFLIRVTGFFCDPEAFEGLQEIVFPSVCEGRSAKQPIRIWVPGCASGEEAYSIAMTSHRFLMLSPSESVGISSDLFELNDKHRLYIRNPTGVNSSPSSLNLEPGVPTRRERLSLNDLERPC